MKASTILIGVLLATMVSVSSSDARSRNLRVVSEQTHTIHVQINPDDPDSHPSRSIDMDGAPTENEQTPAPTDGRSRLWNDTLTPPSDPGPEIVQDPIRFHIAMMEWLAYRIAVRQAQR